MKPPPERIRRWSSNRPAPTNRVFGGRSLVRLSMSDPDAWPEEIRHGTQPFPDGPASSRTGQDRPFPSLLRSERELLMIAHDSGNQTVVAPAGKAPPKPNSDFPVSNLRRRRSSLPTRSRAFVFFIAIEYRFSRKRPHRVFAKHCVKARQSQSSGLAFPCHWRFAFVQLPISMNWVLSKHFVSSTNSRFPRLPCRVGTLFQQSLPSSRNGVKGLCDLCKNTVPLPQFRMRLRVTIA